MKLINLTKSMVALMSSLALVSIASAKPDGKGNGKGKGSSHHAHANKPDKEAKKFAKPDKGPDKDFKTENIVRFADKDRNSILDYFAGFQKRENGLPPGLAKNVARGKALPPGWQKKVQPGYRIEDALWSSFSPVPDAWFPNIRREPNTRFYYHGDRVVRVYEPRREVLDVIEVPSLLR